MNSYFVVFLFLINSLIINKLIILITSVADQSNPDPDPWIRSWKIGSESFKKCLFEEQILSPVNGLFLNDLNIYSDTQLKIKE